MAAWTENEVQVICKVYVKILKLEQAGERVNKAQFCRDTLPLLDGRSRGSYEMKMMNISAAARDAGLPTITGYKPYGAYQKCLKSAISEAWSNS